MTPRGKQRGERDDRGPQPETGRLTPASRIYLGFGAMCLGMFMAILDIQIVATSLPTIQRELVIPPDAASWVQTAYLIAEIVAIPLTGYLTRTFGMRRSFAVAVFLFTVASCGCAASGSFTALVIWRVLQGFAGGTLIPLVFAAVFLLFPFRLQGLATTAAGVLAVLAPTVGPIVGGWITGTYSWHWLFLINVVPGILSTIAGLAFLPRERAPLGASATLDVLSLLLLATGLAALVIGLKEAPHRGWLSVPVAGLLAWAVASGSALVVRSGRADQPIIDFSLMRNRDFAIGSALSFVLGIGLFGSVYLMPVFLAYVRNHDALEIGRIMLVTGVAQLLTAPLAVALERRVDPRLLTAFGFLLFASGMGMSAWQTAETDFNEMIWPQVLRGSAIMFCLLPPTRLALGRLPPQRVPDASALFNLMRNLGGAIGLALIDTVIYGQAAARGEAIAERLAAGDEATRSALGLPSFMMNDGAVVIGQRALQSLIEPRIAKAAFVETTNLAWFMIAGLTLIALLMLPFAHADKPSSDSR